MENTNHAGSATGINLDWSKLREVYAQAGGADEGKLALVKYGVALARAAPQHPDEPSEESVQRLTAYALAGIKEADALRARFDATFLSLNGFHTKSELANAWGALAGDLFRAGADAATPQHSVTFPERDQAKPAEQQGMFRKFEVRRADGSDQPGGKHFGCRYFVLDLTHDQHAPAAMRAYAAACDGTHPQLAADIVAEFGAQHSVTEQAAAAWANWKVGTDSYVPFKTREQAEASMRRSDIAATQEGPYEVIPLFHQKAARALPLASTAATQPEQASKRALFEAWFVAALRKTYPHMPESSVQRMLSRHEDGTYTDLTTQHDWSVWQASIARAALAIPASTAASGDYNAPLDVFKHLARSADAEMRQAVAMLKGGATAASEQQASVSDERPAPPVLSDERRTEAMERYGTGVLPWSCRIPPNQSARVIADAMQDELNELRPLVKSARAALSGRATVASPEDTTIPSSMNEGHLRTLLSIIYAAGVAKMDVTEDYERVLSYVGRATVASPEDTAIPSAADEQASIPNWKARRNADRELLRRAGENDRRLPVSGYMLAEIADLRAALTHRATTAYTYEQAQRHAAEAVTADRKRRATTLPGYKLVPLEPTDEQIKAVHCSPGSLATWNELVSEYRLMVAAAPDTATTAADQQGEQASADGYEWRVGEFWSSANPGKKVLMLAQGIDIENFGRHKDFICWVAQQGAAQAGDVVRLLATLTPILDAVDANDSDSLAMHTSDDTVIWTAMSSWGPSVPVTLGHLRQIFLAAKQVAPDPCFYCGGSTPCPKCVPQAAPDTATTATCWSCKRPYTAEQRADADGNCPHCGVEIEQEETAVAAEVLTLIAEIATSMSSTLQPAADAARKRNDAFLAGMLDTMNSMASIIAGKALTAATEEPK